MCYHPVLSLNKTKKKMKNNYEKVNRKNCLLLIKHFFLDLFFSFLTKRKEEDRKNELAKTKQTHTKTTNRRLFYIEPFK